MKPRGTTLLAIAAVFLAMAAVLALRHRLAHPVAPPGLAPTLSTPPGAPVFRQPAVSSPLPAGSPFAPANDLPPPAPAMIPAGQAISAAAPSDEGAKLELEKIHRMITSYNTLMGENPVGTNAEIMKALMGRNPHQAMLGPPEGGRLNSKGELIDPWGTPYFFHQMSRDDMEIHSAGPDRIMGTPDDLVIQ